MECLKVPVLWSYALAYCTHRWMAEQKHSGFPNTNQFGIAVCRQVPGCCTLLVCLITSDTRSLLQAWCQAKLKMLGKTLLKTVCHCHWGWCPEPHFVLPSFLELLWIRLLRHFLPQRLSMSGLRNSLSSLPQSDFPSFARVAQGCLYSQTPKVPTIAMTSTVTGASQTVDVAYTTGSVVPKYAPLRAYVSKNIVFSKRHAFFECPYCPARFGQLAIWRGAIWYYWGATILMQQSTGNPWQSRPASL